MLRCASHGRRLIPALLKSPGSNSRLMSSTEVPIGRAFDEKEARKWLQFTCTHDQCKQIDERDRIVRKTISTLAYEKGVVLVRCNCEKLHLIADRLSWFEDGGIDIEQIASQKGISLEKGVIEFNPELHAKKHDKPVIPTIQTGTNDKA